jgi:hypothetical protein
VVDFQRSEEQSGKRGRAQVCDSFSNRRFSRKVNGSVGQNAFQSSPDDDHVYSFFRSIPIQERTVRLQSSTEGLNFGATATSTRGAGNRLFRNCGEGLPNGFCLEALFCFDCGQKLPDDDGRRSRHRNPPWPVATAGQDGTVRRRKASEPGKPGFAVKPLLTEIISRVLTEGKRPSARYIARPSSESSVERSAIHCSGTIASGRRCASAREIPDRQINPPRR